MQKIKLRTEESGKKLLAAYAPPKWGETADDDEGYYPIGIAPHSVKDDAVKLTMSNNSIETVEPRPCINCRDCVKTVS